MKNPTDKSSPLPQNDPDLQSPFPVDPIEPVILPDVFTGEDDEYRKSDAIEAIRERHSEESPPVTGINLPM